MHIYISNKDKKLQYYQWTTIGTSGTITSSNHHQKIYVIIKVIKATGNY